SVSPSRVRATTTSPAAPASTNTGSGVRQNWRHHPLMLLIARMVSLDSGVCQSPRSRSRLDSVGGSMLLLLAALAQVPSQSQLRVPLYPGAHFEPRRSAVASHGIKRVHVFLPRD